MRLALSTVAAPPVSVAAVRTSDSKGVTFDYDVNSPNLTPTLEFGVFRSADPIFDAGDTPLASITLSTTSVGRSTIDTAGQPASGVGHHSMTLPVEDGLTIEPDRPFILVVANPSSAVGASDQAARTGVMRTHSIAVVTHGGIQSPSDDVDGPLWQRKMAKAVGAEGYDSVVKYVWSRQSRNPGHAAEQGPQLARILNRIASQYPAGDPVNVHFIGHSEGVVVNTRAAQLLQQKQDPGIEAGYMKMTMLDPHAANNSAPGYQYSVKGGMIGRTAKNTIKFFQWQAEDPVARVPNNVDTAEVFWQHTRVEAANTNHGVYNLWGQVPVIGKAKYYDLTGPGISHAGDYGVPMWYTFNVVPTLQNGGKFVNPTHLTGSHVVTGNDVSTKWFSTAHTAKPEFQGTAAPGATITLFAVRSGSYGWKRVGQTSSDATGKWDVSANALRTGRYRFAVRSAVQAFPGRPGIEVTPRLRLGSVTVHAPRTTNRI